jgi:hypothetical protein
MANKVKMGSLDLKDHKVKKVIVEKLDLKVLRASKGNQVLTVKMGQLLKLLMAIGI